MVVNSASMDPQSLEKLSTFPERLENIIFMFTPEDLNTPDKGGEGWTPMQLVHHISDAHAMAYYRIKWLLTEKHTVLKPFDQDEWANLTQFDDFHASITMLRGVCLRWHALMTSLEPDQWDKQGFHPESGVVNVRDLFTYYVNHGESHLERLASSL